MQVRVKRKDKCPSCGGKVSEVDVIEEIIEFAERTDTKIEFVDDNKTLQELGAQKKSIKPAFSQCSHL